MQWFNAIQEPQSTVFTSPEGASITTTQTGVLKAVIEREGYPKTTMTLTKVDNEVLPPPEEKAQLAALIEPPVRIEEIQTNSKTEERWLVSAYSHSITAERHQLSSTRDPAPARLRKPPKGLKRQYRLVRLGLKPVD